MNSHKNARLTSLGRAHLIKQVDRLGLHVAAAQAGISTRRAREWRRRFDEYGKDGLSDRTSRPHRSPRSTAASICERIINLRRNHRLPYTQIACRTGVSPATVGRICSKACVAKLPPVEAAPPKRRYERQTPGELLHLDTKKLARFDRPGHRVTGDVSRFSKKPGYQALHVAIDDHSRVGFSLMLADETTRSAIAFVFAALRYYRALGVKVTGIMTDNGSACRSKKFAKLLRRLKIRHLRTRPYTPRTNGKAERFIQTLLREWAYAYTYPNSEARTCELPYWIIHYNFHRPHSATGNMPPVSRLGFIGNNVVRNYT
ncbi:MAG: integrase [Gallionellales bacterium RIFCSPLOWO2_02_FULL_57_47]|nr:MAG: integrase [Gallionellales bacterium RIFCSPLOWO2_02_FULL_57_47]OGT12905.1 MAG: integrase [Gallionellales bacterium RIFCSPHIGHO2_02_FULL_57_16]